MRWLGVLLLAALPAAAQSDDAPLNQVRALLTPLRAHPWDNLETRGATPQFTVVKHLLRDWIESRLSAVKPEGDAETLERQLNDDLAQAKLLCGFAKDVNSGLCPDMTFLGFLGQIKLHRALGDLIVQTGVGIQQCGFDESAYAYQWTDQHWKRFWQGEQNDYQDKRYFPQTLEAVLFSPPSYRPRADRSGRLVLTLGTESWCSSNWHPVYYRVWETGSRLPQPKLLLDESQFAYLSVPVRASVGANDVLIEYAVASIDGGVLTRKEIRHYVEDHGGLQRVDPIALSPRDFADEWILHPWAESARWTDPNARPQVEQWHQRNDRKGGEFIETTLHCPQRPDLWQVGIDFGDDDNDEASEYFLIRWRPPYHFSMVDVSEYPWLDCSEEDPEADQPHTLFLQDWH